MDFTHRLAVAFAIVIAVLAGTALVVYRELDAASDEREAATQSYVDDLVLAERLRSSVEQAVASGRGYLLTGNPAFLERMREADEAIDDTRRGLRSRADTPEARSALEAVAGAIQAYRGVQDDLLATMHGRDGDSDAVLGRFERELVPLRRRLELRIDELVQQQESRLHARFEQSRRATQRAAAAGAGALGAATLLCGGLAWYVTRRLAEAFRHEQESVRMAQRASAARQEVLGVVAHDLRNPLSAITIKAGLIRRAPDLARAREHGASVASLAARMEHLIGNLLDAVTLDAGSLAVVRAPCDVGALCRDAVEMFAGLAEAKGVHLELHPEPTDLTVGADRERVLQVLSNLLGNAIKFTPEGGTVAISSELDGAKVRFSISDTGPGIPPEHVPHVFERFWKAASGGRRGTGLGLFIARGIVEAHGGRIWLESQFGRGTTFHFTLPAPGAADASAAREPASPDGARPDA